MNGLRKVLQFVTTPGEPLDQYVETIKACFPTDVVNFYTPGFQETICSQVDNFSGLTSKYMHFMSRYKKKERRGSDAEEEDERS
ncbi:hypothetical protein R5R35_000068 [Gryllus longicercus]|uniref:Uncharacterized protein n=1 Tax=Gryllus longicercus TaxID=2509291 RepID=A0AAN9Z110_9ORTH